MKALKKLILMVFCLLTACQIPKTAPQDMVGETECDSAAIFQDRAYEEMFNGSLAKAEAYAYRAFLMSRDTMMECNALSLLGYIYYREGKQEELQLLMQTISPEMYMSVMDVQTQVEQAKAGRQQSIYVSAIVVLLLLLAALGFWYVRRTKALAQLYQQRIDSVRQKLEISETKVGIDVLHAIINDQNISQMGKHEEQAVLKTLPVVDEALAEALNKATSPLTPVSTSSNMMLGKRMCRAIMVLMHNITRDISPPEAVSLTGMGRWFLLKAIMNSTLSMPLAFRSVVLKSTSKAIFFMPKGDASFNNSFPNRVAASWRLADNCLAMSKAAFRLASTWSFNFWTISSLCSISFNCRS